MYMSFSVSGLELMSTMKKNLRLLLLLSFDQLTNLLAT